MGTPADRHDGHQQAATEPRSSRAVLSPPLRRGERTGVEVRWALVRAPVEDAYVAFTPSGIVSVVPAGTVAGDEGFFAALRHHFGLAVASAPVPPEGVDEALRTGDATGLDVDLAGRTGFQRDVLTATRGIPTGEVRTYGWIAVRIGRPRAVRAVGTALGHNPVPLIVPCHRVVRSDGTLGQYGFGADLKRRLLEHEGVDVDRLAPAQRGPVRR